VTLQSSLYVGSVMHRRIRPRAHHFRYAAFWLLIDLEELPSLSGKLRLFSHNRFNLFSLHDRDHGDGTSTPLRLQAKQHLREAGIDIAGGRIRLLCMPRTFGHCFNPISIYFCHHADSALAALIYQVHNTFGERHSYVIPVTRQPGAVHQHCRKQFHVSPFLDMALNYEFRITIPDQRIAVGIRVGADDGPMFNAALVGARKNLTDGALMGMCLQMPAITLKVIAAIHWEAVRLWLKGMRYRSKPAAPKTMTSVVTTASRNLD
jgi:uncharacterized protein